MKSIFSKPRTKALLGGVVVLGAVAAGGYFVLQSARKFTKTATTTKSETVQSPADNNTGSTNASTTSVPKTYEIKGLNIKDGDVFAVPESLIFTVEPNVDLVRVTLQSSAQKIIYKNELQSSNVNLQVYPDSKLQEGSSGVLLLEGVVDGKVVVTKSVKVVF